MKEYIVRVEDYVDNVFDISARVIPITGSLIRCKDCARREFDGFCTAKRWGNTHDYGFCDEGVSNEQK